MNQDRRKTAVAWLSVISNTTLMSLKVVVGLSIGSVSLISEAIHSGVDLMAAVIALFAVKHASKPADRRHPFGHGKAENLSGTVEALLIFLASAWIIYEAVRRLKHPEPIVDAHWGVAVMLFSVITNLIVSHLLFKVGRETDSVALQADGWHLRTDVYTSAGVMVGLAAMWIGHRLLPSADLRWIDPIAAIFVAVLIIRAAWRLTLDAARDLMDESLPEDELAWIRSHVAGLPAPVEGMHDLRTRKSGADRFVELHLVMDGLTTVHDSHEIADAVEKAIARRLPRATVIVHVDPRDDR
jgi:cation diffusion facilitator family transporter